MTLDTALDPAADATGGGAGKARAPDGTCDKAAAAVATSSSRTDPETAQDAAGSEVGNLDPELGGCNLDLELELATRRHAATRSRSGAASAQRER
jgi:hypothetical protein